MVKKGLIPAVNKSDSCYIVCT